MKIIKLAIVCFVALVANFQLCHTVPAVDTEQDRNYLNEDYHPKLGMNKKKQQG